MYGHLRRGKSGFRPAKEMAEELALKKEIEAVKEAYRIVIFDLHGRDPSLKYAHSVFIKAARNLLAVQQLDPGCTATSFVDVVFNSYARDAEISFTVLASDKAQEIAVRDGRSRRVHNATTVVEQLDNLSDLGHWMTERQLLDWADTNNYSPLTLYLFGVVVDNAKMIADFKWFVDRDMGRTEKLPEIIALIPERQAKLFPNSLVRVGGGGLPA